MTEPAPVPPHLFKNLSTRARNVLINLKVESHQDLIALSERGLPKIRWCGTKTTAELTRLLEGVQLDYVPMHSSLAQPSGCAEGAAASEVSAPRMAAVPSKWSILNSTLAELFTDAASSSQYAWPETIKLPPADLVRLRAAGIFPEDTPYLLCSFTIEYLLEAGLSDAALSAMLHAVVRGSQLPGDALPTLAVVPADVSLYADFPEGLLDPLIVPDFPFPPLLGFVDAPTDAVAWSVVAKITERSVIKRLGFSVTALRAIRYLWQLKERAVAFVESAAAGLPTALYLDLDRLLDQYTLTAGTNGGGTEPPKHWDWYPRLARKRFGPAANKVSLRKLGEEIGVTTERVRQVESKLLQKLTDGANLLHLDYLWRLLDHFLFSSGGARYAYELCLSLQTVHGWDAPPSEETLCVLMGLSPRYRVDTDSFPVRISLTTACCTGCEAAGAALSEALMASKTATFTYDHALDVVRGACVRMQCPELRKITSFSPSLVEFIADPSPSLSVHDQEVHLELPQHKCTLIQELEEVMLSAPDGMHYKEAYQCLKLLNPETTTSAQSVHGRLTDAKWALLWGMGTFKHRALLTIPVPLITEILEDFAYELERYDVPYLCANGHHFDRYAERLRAQDIPTSRALYSCMKIVGSPTMSFEEYPYVLRKSHVGPRPPVSLLIEQFLLKARRAVSYKQLKDFEVGILGGHILHMHSHLNRSRNVLKIENILLHIDHTQYVTDQLRRMVETPPLEDDGSEPTEVALFRKHQDACEAIGIAGPKELFCFVERFLPGTVNWHLDPNRKYPLWKQAAVKDEKVQAKPKSKSRRPKSPSPEPPAKRTTAAPPPADWVYAYLEDLGKPCLTKNLFEAFRTDPLQNNLYKLWFGKTERVLWYSRDSVIARKTLEWDDEKQYALETLALVHLEHAEGRNKPYGSCRELLLHHSGQLPELAQGLAWTPVLLHGLLVSGDNFVQIGRQKDLFVSVDNSQGIQTLNDLLYHLLLAEHGGCTPKKEFMAVCEREGIILKPSALFLTGKDPRVVIDGDVIRAAALEAGG